MTLVKRTNDNMFPAFNSIFDDIFKTAYDNNLSKSRATVPSVNIKENDDAFTIDVAAPGMKKNDFNIEIDDDILTISAEAKNENEKKDENYSCKEFSYNSFNRSFTLPEFKIDTEKIKAKYNDGILNLTIPKKEEAKPKPARSIKIS